MTDPVLECDPVNPHPDAVYNGTCPAPDGWTPPPGWEEPSASDDTGLNPPVTSPSSDGGSDGVSDSPIASTSSTDGSGSQHQSTTTGDDSDGSLPITGYDIGTAAGLGGVLIMVGVVVMLWVKRRDRKSTASSS